MQYSQAVAVASANEAPSGPPKTMSDAALVDAIAAGDKHALQVLYGRHHVKVYRFALRFVRDEAAAEDMVSEVFIDVWRQAERFERRSQVSTWLLAIARNKALSTLRRRSNEQLDEEVAEFIEDPADNPEVTMQKQERSRDPALVPGAAVAGAPRDHRPRLLSRAVDRGGVRDHRRAGQHREDPHVLCPQADRRDDGGPRHRALRDLSSGLDPLFPSDRSESGEVPPKRGTSCFVRPADGRNGPASCGPRGRARARRARTSMIPCPDCGGQGIAPLLRRHLRAAGSGAATGPAHGANKVHDRRAQTRSRHHSIVQRGDVQDRGAGARARAAHRPAAVARPRRVRFRPHRRSPRRRRLSRAAAAAARHRSEPQSRALCRPARLRRRHRGRDRERRRRRRASSPAMPSATGSRACSPPTGPTWCAASSLIAANVGHAPRTPPIREAIRNSADPCAARRGAAQGAAASRSSRPATIRVPGSKGWHPGGAGGAAHRRRPHLAARRTTPAATRRSSICSRATIRWRTSRMRRSSSARSATA